MSAGIDRFTGRPLAVLPAVLALLAGVAVAVGPAGAQSDSNLVRAELLLRRGSTAEAAALLERELGTMPSADAHYLYGFALIQLFRFEEAETSLRQAVAMKPFLADWHEALAKAQLEQGKNLAAIDSLNRALELEPKPDFHFAKAMCALNIGDLTLAERELEASLLGAPERVDAHLALGRIRFDRGEWVASARSFERALAIDRRLVEALYLAGLAASRTGRLEDARERFEGALAIVPGHVGALYNLGRVLGQLGETEESRRRLAEFERVSRIDDHADFLARGVRKNPESVAGRLELASALMTLGKTRDALDQLLAARTLEPRRERTYRLLAEAFRRLGRDADAEHAERFAQELVAGQP